MTRLRQGSGGQASRPPRFASWLLGRTLEERRREELLGDLEELFQIKAHEQGRTAARRWFWRQAAQAIVDAIRERRFGSAP